MAQWWRWLANSGASRWPTVGAGRRPRHLLTEPGVGKNARAVCTAPLLRRAA
ncbi:MAG: hypothetical protein AVDCRST_MAG77-614 [uncultured Chloroflexi bacterium]|uniref:Uncharacterized protein n=1 Tax=uncultured Chloroflexota bacterium TaxID=166587 RepID=A0A6J4HG24_9CHLR|nr:MAG: hypothetical protein AVDCRST_MAG77-614 [uncultured Chloroflexota bacterium]